jgi:hypothetical protein
MRYLAFLMIMWFTGVSSYADEPGMRVWRYSASEENGDKLTLEWEIFISDSGQLAFGSLELQSADDESDDESVAYAFRRIKNRENYASFDVTLVSASSLTRVRYRISLEHFDGLPDAVDSTVYREDRPTEVRSVRFERRAFEAEGH